MYLNATTSSFNNIHNIIIAAYNCNKFRLKRSAERSRSQFSQRPARRIVDVNCVAPEISDRRHSIDFIAPFLLHIGYTTCLPGAKLKVENIGWSF